MRRIESMEDELRDVATYELASGERVTIAGAAVRELGAAECLRRHGYGNQLPIERQAVTQHGRLVGTVPPDFDPMFITSRSFLYEPRRGDFTRDEAGGWTAAQTLGPGDLEAVTGFVWADTP